MKLESNRRPGGSAFFPAVVTAIVLRIGALGRRPTPKHVRAKTAIERVFASSWSEVVPPAQW
jgi:hypothetical protein